MKPKGVGHSFALLLLLITGAASTLHAQENRGTILGRVTDASGATVARTDIQVMNPDTGMQVTTFTNEEGAYQVSSLPPGRYTVSEAPARSSRKSISDFRCFSCSSHISTSRTMS